MKEIITSLQNPKIKNICLLIEKSSERRKQQKIVIEGLREITLALEAGQISAEQLFYCEEIFQSEQYNLLEQLIQRKCPAISISKTVFDKIAFRENSDGMVLLAKPNFIKLEDLKLSNTPLIIVLESVEKPGNLGAVLRTADAAGVDAVVICDPKTDLYNPNTIRSSVGCIFTCAICATSSEELLVWLNKKNIQVFSAALTAQKLYHQTDLKKGTALVFGTEAYGLSSFWLENATQIKIPMLGKIDSLNISNSVAIMVFEAMRQRNFTNL